MTPAFLTTGEVSRMSGYSIDVVRREIDRGNLAAVRLGRYWAVEPGEARRWANQFEPYVSTVRAGEEEEVPG